MTTHEIIAAINAWADMADTQRDHYGNVMSNSQFRRSNPAAYAVKCAALDALMCVDRWTEVKKIDDTQTVLRAPDGIEVVYSHGGDAERLALAEDESEQQASEQPHP